MTEFPLDGAGLSAQGRQRREAMRDALMHEVDRRRTQRRAVRIGAGAAAFAVTALGAWAVLLASRAAPTPERPPLVADTQATTPEVPTPAMPRIDFELVAGSTAPDDPRIVRTASASAESIGDDELLLLLEAAGHPAAGLIRTADTARVTVAIPPLPARADPG